MYFSCCFWSKNIHLVNILLSKYFIPPKIYQHFFTENLTINNDKYSLVSIIKKSGDEQSGHYINYSKYDNIWYKYDDSTRTELKTPASIIIKNKDSFYPTSILYERIN